jgi:hypothetical protein
MQEASFPLMDVGPVWFDITINFRDQDEMWACGGGGRFGVKCFRMREKKNVEGL